MRTQKHISHRHAAVHGHNAALHHGLHEEHPGIEKALIGAGIFGALVLMLAGIAMMVG
jgi:hypothetical protein